MKTWFLPVLVMVTFMSCVPEPGWEVTVKGKVDFSGDGAVTIMAWADTAKTELPVEWDSQSRTFSVKLRLTEPGFYRLTFFESQFADIILYRSDVTVNVDEQGNSKIEGSPEWKVYEQVESVRMRFQQSDLVASLNAAFSDAVARNDEAGMEEIRETFLAEMRKVDDSVMQVLKVSMPSVAVIDLLNRNTLDPDRYMAFYQEVADGFTGEWAGYSMVTEFRKQVGRMKTTAIGAAAPEIRLPDPEGKIVSLSDYRGKYVLVDFWAKWCGPCRQENPNLVKAWKRFRDREFQVIGVSLDRNKADWLQAIEEDGLEWVHVSDLQYFNSVAARDYNINAIPFSVLIDPKGVIVAKNMRGSELERTLERFLEGPSGE